MIISALWAGGIPTSGPADRLLGEQEKADYAEDLARVPDSTSAKSVRDSIQGRIGEVTRARLAGDRERKQDRGRFTDSQRRASKESARRDERSGKAKEDDINDAYRKMLIMCSSLGEVEKTCGQASVHLKYGQVATLQASFERAGRELITGGEPIRRWPEQEFRPAIPELQAQVIKAYMETLDKFAGRDARFTLGVLTRSDAEFRQIWAKLVTKETPVRSSKTSPQAEKPTDLYKSARSEMAVGLAKVWIKIRGAAVVDVPSAMKADYWKQEAMNEDEAFRQAMQPKPQPGSPVAPVPGGQEIQHPAPGVRGKV